jgi:hypothetical protein
MTDDQHDTSSGELRAVALDRLRFPVLAAFVTGLVALHAVRGHWMGDYDFWEHSAVVREFITELTRPRHPLLLVDAPHAFANPYAWIVALLCRLTGASPVAGLAAASVVNLVMLLIALHVFVRRFASAQARVVAFYLLLFMLLLWGREPWDFSGFYHIGALNHTLAYPSACAFWVSLLLLALEGKRVAEGRYRLLVVTVPTTAFVLLVHPPTFLFVATGLAAIAVDARHRRREMLVAAGSLAGAVALALAWPHFPVWELLTGGMSSFNASNAPMYSQPLLKTFPAMLGVPLLLVHARRTGHWSLVAWVLLLVGVYAFGFATGKYNYGRVIFFIVFLLQLEIARFVSRLEFTSVGKGARHAPLLLATAMVAVCLLLSARPLVGAAHDSLRGGRTYASYRFLSREVGQYDVMMTGRRTGAIAASFGGKVISTLHPLAFVPEDEQKAREADVKSFFQSATSQAQRIRLLRNYRVTYVLATRSPSADSTAVSDSALSELGEVRHADDRFLLIRVDPCTRHQPPDAPRTGMRRGPAAPLDTRGGPDSLAVICRAG